MVPTFPSIESRKVMNKFSEEDLYCAERIQNIQQRIHERTLKNIRRRYREVPNVRALLIHIYEKGHDCNRIPRHLPEYKALLFYNYGVGEDYAQEIKNEYWNLVHEHIIEPPESVEPKHP